MAAESRRYLPALASVVRTAAAACIAATLLMPEVSDATSRKTLASSSGAQRARPASQPVSRANSPAVVAIAASDGEAGYVHFFLLQDAEGWTETQVGIQLEGERIAWSFPDLGVVVTPFLKSGSVEVHGKRYAWEHLYGLRPFPDERSMRALQSDLPWRVAPYVENGTPYCYLRERGDPFCLSCLDLVARLLFPGHFPEQPALPRDFQRTTHAVAHTTDDLLLYLLGLQALPNRAARLRRIERLALPDTLRADAISLVDSIPDPSRRVAESRGASEFKNRGAGQQRVTRRKKS